MRAKCNGTLKKSNESISLMPIYRKQEPVPSQKTLASAAAGAVLFTGRGRPVIVAAAGPVIFLVRLCRPGSTCGDFIYCWKYRGYADNRKTITVTHALKTDFGQTSVVKNMLQ